MLDSFPGRSSTNSHFCVRSTHSGPLARGGFSMGLFHRKVLYNFHHFDLCSIHSGIFARGGFIMIRLFHRKALTDFSRGRSFKRRFSWTFPQKEKIQVWSPGMFGHFVDVLDRLHCSQEWGSFITVLRMT